MKLICYPPNSSIKAIRTNQAPLSDLCFSIAIFSNFLIITQRLPFQSVTRGGLERLKDAKNGHREDCTSRDCFKTHEIDNQYKFLLYKINVSFRILAFRLNIIVGFSPDYYKMPTTVR